VVLWVDVGRAVLDGAADGPDAELAEEDPHEVRITSSDNIPTRVFTARSIVRPRGGRSEAAGTGARAVEGGGNRARVLAGGGNRASK
jgi:hypothetical protein